MQSLQPFSATTPFASQPPIHAPSERNTQLTERRIRWLYGVITIVMGVMFFGLALGLHYLLEQRSEGSTAKMERLRFLPSGDRLKPALLGHHYLGADFIWLQIVQVLGERSHTGKDFEWLRHALSVVTTLDPQYVYAYDVGGVILSEWAERVDWSNALLEKGSAANPMSWRLPFLMGFNYFFHLQNHVAAGEYMAKAAQIPGRPYFIDLFAARLYSEGNSHALALQYLEMMIQQTPDERMQAGYKERYKEVLISRDIHMIEEAIARYTIEKKKSPVNLIELAGAGYLSSVPAEPFGGEYHIEERTGKVSSSTHPEGLRLYHPSDAVRFMR